eukprot:scaffold96921_cov32-Prasinocladus_malaysianus.AAC.1
MATAGIVIRGVHRASVTLSFACNNGVDSHDAGCMVFYIFAIHPSSMLWCPGPCQEADLLRVKR